MRWVFFDKQIITCKKKNMRGVINLCCISRENERQFRSEMDEEMANNNAIANPDRQQRGSFYLRVQ